MKHVLIIGLLSLASSAALAQGVWRCGPDGRSYSDTPCKDGSALELPIARPAGDVAEAGTQARQDVALAERLARERQAREAPVALQAGGIRGSRLAEAPRAGAPFRPKVRDLPARPRPHRLEGADTWRATAASSRRTKD